MGLMGLAANLFFERPARKHSIDELAHKLEASTAKVAQRIANMQETDRNRETVLHIIGMERWGQSRLKVALGDPLTLDEHDGYRPAENTPWDALLTEFKTTREETVTIANQLQGTEGKSVPHNQFGDMSIKGWLNYLNSHANLTARMLR